MHPIATRIYYSLKPLIPRRIQIYLRRRLVHLQRAKYDDVWPIDERAARKPEGWQGWPGGKQFALVLTHDVDTAKGQERCYNLAHLEEQLNFRSSFNFVPERYKVSSELRQYLASHGFEVGVHGLCHDGRYYESREIFRERAIKINQYVKHWGSVGFRSPSMQHNLEWIHDLDIEYDASTFDTDPFEPQSDGYATIFPFWVQGKGPGRGYVELPYTLPQDFTLFILMREKTINIWKDKLDWIAAKGGMALINVHPDYMDFDDKPGLEKYPSSYYEEFLSFLSTQYKERYWHALPSEIARFWAGPKHRLHSRGEGGGR